jgi:Zn-dependent M28 family amino/carboxypeptidase
VSAPTVLGLITGGDPALKPDVIVLSAHLDHLGILPASIPASPSGGARDSIYNGADDNASGVAVVLSVAEALAHASPRLARSVLVVFPSGEESGLWGTKYLFAHSPVPTSHFLAAVNSDMLARNAPDTVALIGGERSDLGARLHAVASRHPEIGLAVAGDLWPSSGLFERSDQHEFAAHGVPAVLLTSGPHASYHEVSDEVQTLDYVKLTRVARLLWYYASDLAGTGMRPVSSDSSHHVPTTPK